MESNDQPREVQIFQSANRPNLIMGGDREMVLLAGLLSAALIFSIATVWAIAVGISAWVFAVAALSVGIQSRTSLVSGPFSIPHVNAHLLDPAGLGDGDPAGRRR